VKGQGERRKETGKRRPENGETDQGSSGISWNLKMKINIVVYFPLLS